MREELERELERGAQALGLSLSVGARRRLLDYLELLAKWNRAYNLTAVRDPQQMVARHLLDSLAVIPYITGGRVADIGSGAGLPGIPLAVALPALQFVLVDSNLKKARFLRTAVAALGLTNIAVERVRVEQFRPPVKFDTLISRAFAALADILTAAGHLCRAEGRILAMKGTYPAEELTAVPDTYVVETVVPLTVPGLDAERHLVVLRPAPT